MLIFKFLNKYSYFVIEVLLIISERILSVIFYFADQLDGRNSCYFLVVPLVFKLSVHCYQNRFFSIVSYQEAYTCLFEIQ